MKNKLSPLLMAQMTVAVFKHLESDWDNKTAPYIKSTPDGEVISTCDFTEELVTALELITGRLGIDPTDSELLSLALNIFSIYAISTQSSVVRVDASKPTPKLKPSKEAPQKPPVVDDRVLH